MADLKISQLTGATTPLGGTEEVPLVQSGTTKKVSVANLTAGRAVAGSSFQAGGRVTVGSSYIADVPGPTGNNTGILFGGNTLFPCDGSGSPTNGVASLGSGSYRFNDIHIAGNLIPGTAAKGVNFTANTPAAGMTSQLLNWYEEGTFTATIEGSTSAGTASYTAQSATYTRIGRVVYFQIYLVWDSGTGTGDLYVGGLPFQSAAGTAAYGGAFTPVLLNVALSANNYCSGAYVLSSNTKLRFYQTPTGGGAASAVPYDAAGEMMLVGQYFV